MANHHTYTITGAADIELGTPRPHPLRYRLALPSESSGALPGLVFLIPGFGEDNDAGYTDSFGGWVADTFGMACVTVAYHAHGCRPSSGAQRQFAQPDADRLVQYCQSHGVPLRNDEGPGVWMDKLQQVYLAKVATGQASGMLTLTCGLTSLNDEVQNFGLMQALDHLHVLADLRSKLDYDKRNVVAIGSSHGGYLAQLIAKLAPNTLRAVFDNAGYALPPERYVNGREANLPDYIERYSEVMQMFFFVDSMWSFDAASPHYFHDDARALRTLPVQTHLETMGNTGARRTRYRCVHGPNDPIAPTEVKAAYCRALAEVGFDVHYQCMGPDDVDGRYVKSLEHGCGLSLRLFFEKSYATLPASDLAGGDGGWQGDDFDRETVVSYAGPERVYRFAFAPGGLEAGLTLGPKR